MEHYIQHPKTQNHSNQDGINKWKPISTAVESNSSGGFDCNICLDSVHDPVVTFCGHMYCWPCIYRWIDSRMSSSDEFTEQQPQCPVCKSDVSLNSLIPLYGRGQPSKSSRGKDAEVGPIVPQRPNGPVRGVHTLVTATTSTSSPHPSNHHHRDGYPRQQVHPYYYPTSPALGFEGMFGEMIYARIFGNSETTLYTYPNTYSVGRSSSARGRRHVMQVDRSLSRVSFFLCCCIILCLLLF